MTATSVEKEEIIIENQISFINTFLTLIRNGVAVFW